MERRGGGGRDEREHRGGWELWGTEVERKIRRPIWRYAGSTLSGDYARPPAGEKAAEGDQGRGRSCNFFLCFFRLARVRSEIFGGEWRAKQQFLAVKFSC